MRDDEALCTSVAVRLITKEVSQKIATSSETSAEFRLDEQLRLVVLLMGAFTLLPCNLLWKDKGEEDADIQALREIIPATW